MNVGIWNLFLEFLRLYIYIYRDEPPGKSFMASIWRATRCLRLSYRGGVVLCITIVGIPWGLQCFKLAGLVLWPFGKQIVSNSANTGCLNTLFNIIWILCGGWYTALIHIVMGLILCLTIVGIPWGRQHFKLIEISLMPFGKTTINT